MDPDPLLMKILVCPVTRSCLQYGGNKQELVSKESGLAYPIQNGVPIMLVNRARAIDVEMD